MDMELRGKRVLVTGGSKGIGFACAEAFAAEGCNVILAARNPDEAAAGLRGRFQVGVEAVAADLGWACILGAVGCKSGRSNIQNIRFRLLLQGLQIRYPAVDISPSNLVTKL